MSERHWSQVGEAGALAGLKFMFVVYRYLGRAPFKLFLYPVILYFFLFRKASRDASLEFLSRAKRGPEPVSWKTSFRHFMNFGESILDKLAVWQGDIKLEDVLFHPRQEFDQLFESQQGAVIIGSHLGNLEVCRALSLQRPNTKINVLMHTEHAQKFNDMLKKAGAKSQVQIIQVTNVSPATAMMLSEKISAGEFVVIAGDRTPVNGGSNVSRVNFLGAQASFPQGPFILASILKCPVFTMYCLRTGKDMPHRYEIFLQPFSERLVLPRKERQQAIEETVQRYADGLAEKCSYAPLQWYNFHSIWAEPTL